MPVHVEVHGAAQIARKFANTGARAVMWQREMEAETSRVIVPAAAAASPVFTGALRGSWRGSALSTGIAFGGTAGSSLQYAPPIESGRRAGAPQPPPGALDAWVSSHLGRGVSAFVVGRAIARRGIPPKRPLGHAVDATLPERLVMRAALMRRLIVDS